MQIVSFILSFYAILPLFITSINGQFYELVHTYDPSNIFNDMSFYTGPDPTGGFVNYVDASTAMYLGLLNASATSVYIGSDHTYVYPLNGTGRPSVRLESKMSYTYGLFILDLNHIPFGCGVWPAWWTIGPNWPQNGEIDIIEGINDAVTNLASLHTSPGCSFSPSTVQTGALVHDDCSAAGENIGCGTQLSGTNNFGAGFNANGGGVYAMQWTPQNISIWFFPRGSIPITIAANIPEPSTFGPPAATYQASPTCNIDSHFFNHTIVLDTTFCGDYAGNNYGNSRCPQISGMTPRQSCEQFVSGQPAGMSEAYWSINYMSVFQIVNRTNMPLPSQLVPVAVPAATPQEVPLGSPSANPLDGWNFLIPPQRQE